MELVSRPTGEITDPQISNSPHHVVGERTGKSTKKERSDWCKLLISSWNIQPTSPCCEGDVSWTLTLIYDWQADRGSPTKLMPLTDMIWSAMLRWPHRAAHVLWETYPELLPWYMTGMPTGEAPPSWCHWLIWSGPLYWADHTAPPMFCGRRILNSYLDIRLACRQGKPHQADAIDWYDLVPYVELAAPRRGACGAHVG